MRKTQIELISIDQLLLDPENPRLPEELHGAQQKDIIQHIARHEAVEDLMAAIGRNGFFEGEPLVVYQAKGDGNKWRVIEGNRRLASVKLLNNPGLYRSRKAISEIAEESPKGNIPTALPVVKVSTRDSALPYLGSRHIVGVKEWEPLPKARYINQLFQLTSSSRPARERYRNVAVQIGSGKRSDYIRKNLNALAVYNVIKKAKFFGDSNANELNFSFGVLYTALDWKSIAGFVGVIDYDAKTDTNLGDNDPIISPKSLIRAGIAEIYSWCFERDNDGETVLGESRNLSQLSAVLRSPSALKTLRATRDLKAAYERSEGVSDELVTALSRALGDLRYCNSVIANALVDELVVDLATKVSAQAEAISEAAVKGAKKKRLNR